MTDAECANRKKNHISDFSDFLFSSYGHFCTKNCLFSMNFHDNSNNKNQKIYQPPAQKKMFFKFLLSPAKKYKSDHISKTKSHKKKSFAQKMSARSIPIYSANLATFEGSWIFGCPKHPVRTAKTRYDVIWNFKPIIFFSTLRIFYVEMTISEGEVCISVVEKQPK